MNFLSFIIFLLQQTFYACRLFSSYFFVSLLNINFSTFWHEIISRNPPYDIFVSKHDGNGSSSSFSQVLGSLTLGSEYLYQLLAFSHPPRFSSSCEREIMWRVSMMRALVMNIRLGVSILIYWMRFFYNCGDNTLEALKSCFIRKLFWE